MKLNVVLAAALTLGVAVSSHAASYTVTTDSFLNSTGGGVGASVGTAGLDLTFGESFMVSTDASQLWQGANDGNTVLLTSNADGSAPNPYATFLTGIGTVQVGTLVADIGGDYRVIGAGDHTFTAWAAGEIFFHYADINYTDNSGAITSTVTTAAAVPEPANVALLLAGLGLMGVVARRRAAK